MTHEEERRLREALVPDCVSSILHAMRTPGNILYKAICSHCGYPTASCRQKDANGDWPKNPDKSCAQLMHEGWEAEKARRFKYEPVADQELVGKTVAAVLCYSPWCIYVEFDDGSHVTFVSSTNERDAGGSTVDFSEIGTEGIKVARRRIEEQRAQGD